jgi:uncharacterized delta-60 repeat protein/uncharacterized repeat protein (TIGR02543 family)
MRSLSVILLAVFGSLLLLGCEPGKPRRIDILIVESEYGSPTPPVGRNYAKWGLTITASVDSPVAVGEGIYYACTGWSGTGSVPPAGSTNSVTFIITENTSISWNWKMQYGLTVTILPVGSGTVTRLPDSICYDPDTSVQLTAVPNAGCQFTGWSGDLTGTTNPQNLTMDEPKSVTANFTLVTWAKSYGGTWSDGASSIQQTSDGGYVVAGCTYSFGAGYRLDFWVLKLNSDGTVSWQKRYGGADDDSAYSIQQTSDGGYIVAGFAFVYSTLSCDFWVVKLNSSGTVAWQKRYGGSGHDAANSIQQTSDGGYIVAGCTGSFGISGDWRFWVLKLDSDGTVAWQKTYGGTEWEEARSIQQTSDGGYIVAGYTWSFGAGFRDFWVLKLDSDGTVSWQKIYGGANYDEVQSIQQTSDGGYIVAGYTSSFGAGYSDFWVLKLNSDGTVSWQKTYGGADDDIAWSIQQTSDGGYVVAGYTSSFGSDGNDFWVLKLNADGAVSWQKRYGGANNDYASSIQQTTDGRYVVAGDTGGDFWVLKLNSDGTIPFNPASGAQMADTNAVPVDTDCTVADTTATAIDTSATATDTNATITDTTATIEQQAP